MLTHTHTQGGRDGREEGRRERGRGRRGRERERTGTPRPPSFKGTTRINSVAW